MANKEADILDPHTLKPLTAKEAILTPYEAPVVSNPWPATGQRIPDPRGARVN